MILSVFIEGRIYEFNYAIILMSGAVVHSGERRVCIAKVGGSNPPGSTNRLQKYSRS